MSAEGKPKITCERHFSCGAQHQYICFNSCQYSTLKRTYNNKLPSFRFPVSLLYYFTYVLRPKGLNTFFFALWELALINNSMFTTWVTE